MKAPIQEVLNQLKKKLAETIRHADWSREAAQKYEIEAINLKQAIAELENFCGDENIKIGKSLGRTE